MLLRLTGLDRATPVERRATLWIAVMFFCALGSTYVMRPLRDQFGVDQGPLRMPWLYGLTLLATACTVPPFWWACSRWPSRRFVPIVLQVCALVVALAAISFAAIGEYQWSSVPWLGEAFWAGYSAVNVVVPTLVWIHAVEHFQRDAGERLFGLLAAGGTLGAITGSALAKALAGGDLPLWASLAAAVLLLQGARFAFLASLPACRRMVEQRGGGERLATGGLLAGLAVLRRDGRARGIAVYMMLLGVLATAFYIAQTDLIGKNVQRSRDQHSLLADVEFWSQTLVLFLQLFCTGRLLRRWPSAALLVSLPLVSIAGLSALWSMPAVLTINLVMIARRGAQFAFEKPAREVLYTPLDLVTKHKVKFLLDTFAFRFGDWLGALLQVALLQSAVGAAGSVAVTIGVAVVWILLGLWLGRRQSSSS
jgi:ATP:ADP antiporter, AAA family